MVDDLLWLVREVMGEEAELIQADSATLGRGRAAIGLLRGGLDADDVAVAVRRTGARVVHAHNLLPSFGWRALAAARGAGARVVAHLHQYRLVCAVGVCFTRGEDCTRCHGRNTLPGVRLNCRGTGPEAAVYGASLALWQRRVADHVDRFVVPSGAAERRLRELGAPLGDRVHVLPHVVRSFAEVAAPRADGAALVASRLAPEKGVDVAIEACRLAGVPLVVAGDGPERERLRRLGPDVRFTGRIPPGDLARLREEAGVAVVPSRSVETFGLAAAEAMAAGLPVAASRIGALADLVDEPGLAPANDARALAAAIARRRGDAAAAADGLRRVQALCAPAHVAAALRTIYG